MTKLRLQKRGTGGVDTAAEGGTYDISNTDRLGKSEASAVGCMGLVGKKKKKKFMYNYIACMGAGTLLEV